MSKEEPYRDQAERLRKKIEKYNESDLKEAALPPRSTLHSKKKQRTKWKVKYPLIRLLVLFFILLPITIFSIYSYIGSKHNGTEKASVSSKEYETINFEKSKNEQINHAAKSNKGKTNSPDQPKDNSSSIQQTTGNETGTSQSSLSPSTQNNSPNTANNTDKTPSK